MTFLPASGTKTAFSPLRPRGSRGRSGGRGEGSSVDYDGSISGFSGSRRKQAVSRYLHAPPYLGPKPPLKLSYRRSWLDVANSLLHPQHRALSAFVLDQTVWGRRTFPVLMRAAY